jgi:hypothetical protein
MSTDRHGLFHPFSPSSSKETIPPSSSAMSIDDTPTTTTLLSTIEIPDSSLGYPDMNISSKYQSSPPQSIRRPTIRIPNETSSTRSPHSPVHHSPLATQHSPSRRSKLTSPVFTSLREKDDPYFLALPDSSRTKILSNSAPDLNTLPHPPPRAHRRPPREIQNGNGRLIEHLHSSRRHSSIGLSSQLPADGPLSRRSTLRAPFRLQRQGSPSSDSSRNRDSDSESEIFEDDRSSYGGSTASTRPSSFSSTASFSETYLRSSASTNNLTGKNRGRSSLTPAFSPLDLIKKRENIVLPERDNIETEDCRFLESEYHRYFSYCLRSNAALRH